MSSKFNKLGRGGFTGGSRLTSNRPGSLDDLIKNLALKKETILAPLATAQNIHAQFVAAFASAAGITQLSCPRVLQVVFSAGWNGGDVKITGVRNDGATISETVAAPAGGGTVLTVNAFLSVTYLENLGTFSAGTVDVQTSTKLAICARGSAVTFVALSTDHVREAFSTSAAAYGTFTPTTGPNAAHNYEVYYTIDDVAAPSIPM